MTVWLSVFFSHFLFTWTGSGHTYARRLGQQPCVSPAPFTPAPAAIVILAHMLASEGLSFLTSHGVQKAPLSGFYLTHTSCEALWLSLATKHTYTSGCWYPVFLSRMIYFSPPVWMVLVLRGFLGIPSSLLSSSAAFPYIFAFVFVCLMGIFSFKCILTPLAPERLDNCSEGDVMHNHATHTRTGCEWKARAAHRRRPQIWH